MRIVLEGQVASKKNSKQIVYNPRTKRRFVVSSANYNQWHKDALWQLKGAQRVSEYPVQMTLTFFFKDQRRRDLSNLAQSIEDTLVDADILEDDDWKHIAVLILKSGGVDKASARVEIDITQC